MDGTDDILDANLRLDQVAVSAEGFTAGALVVT